MVDRLLRTLLGERLLPSNWTKVRGWQCFAKVLPSVPPPGRQLRADCCCCCDGALASRPGFQLPWLRGHPPTAPYPPWGSRPTAVRRMSPSLMASRLRSSLPHSMRARQLRQPRSSVALRNSIVVAMRNCLSPAPAAMEWTRRAAALPRWQWPSLATARPPPQARTRRAPPVVWQ